MPKKARKKSLVGWTYDDEDFEFKSVSAWHDSPLGLNLYILKYKKDLGKFKGYKVRITIEEV